MSELSIQLKWQLGEGELVQGKYSNSHEITYNDQFQLTADAAPDWGGDVANTNPEQALAASISSCHMMTFLALAAKAKWPVSSYDDKAEAFLGKNSDSEFKSFIISPPQYLLTFFEKSLFITSTAPEPSCISIKLISKCKEFK